MADRKKHKYVQKVRTKSGKTRYIYDKNRSVKDQLVDLTKDNFIDSVKDYAHDEFFNRYTEDMKTKAERQKQQQERIINNGKLFINMLLLPSD